MLNIDANNVLPQDLCERGGEKIILPLSVSCPKNGKIVH